MAVLCDLVAEDFFRRTRPHREPRSRPIGREWAAVDVDVGPERRSPRYHETCLALESVKESSAAVSKPRCVWSRVPIFKDLEKARRLPVRVEEQQAQQLAVNPPRSAGDGRQEPLMA